MLKENKSKEERPSASFEQIDITTGYQTAYRKISDNNQMTISAKLKDKIYPEGVKKVTYSPQTESIYYYNNSSSTSGYKLKWELFEDRGATIETQLINNLIEIDEIKSDFEKITQEEKQLDYMPLDSIVEKICDFMKMHGEKAYRFRIDLKQNEKCKIFSFWRANHTEEIILFTSDKHLVLSRFEEDNKFYQKSIKTMNRTIMCWYYEGLLRMKRLEEKQQKYLRKIQE